MNCGPARLLVVNRAMPMTGNSGPLAGYRVIDATHHFAGSYCGMLLADWGADVIKVEEPGVGDSLRKIGDLMIKGESALFLETNRGKRSLTVDLRKPMGADIILALAKTADVFLQNFRPGTVERYGLAYEDIRRRNESIVYCSISAFGPTGPYAARPGLDPVIQAMSGLMSITGARDGGPTLVGAPYGDSLAASAAFQGILLALLHRARTGMGQHVSIAMIDAMLASLAPREQIFFLTGQKLIRHGTAHPNIAPYQAFLCADGFHVIAAANDKFWSRLLATLGIEGLSSDPRFATNTLRVEHRDELAAEIEAATRTRSRADLQATLDAAGIPNGPVYELHETLNDPQVVHNGMVRQVESDSGAGYRVLGSPIRLSSCTPRYRAAPALGDSTDTILSEIGYAPEKIDQLRRSRTI